MKNEKYTQFAFCHMWDDEINQALFCNPHCNLW